MASSTHRVGPHSSANYAAIQGAALAFQAHSREDSEIPPEVGSVKDKIGRFAKFDSSPARVSADASSQNEKASTTHLSQQNTPAQVAAQKPPVSSRKHIAITNTSSLRDESKPRDERKVDKRDIASDTPESHIKAVAINESTPKPSSSGKNQSLRNKAIPQEPTNSSTSLSPAQVAATKPRVLPPTPRKDTVPTSGPSSAPASATTKKSKSFDESPTPSSRSSAAPKGSPIWTDKQGPALPSRSNTSPMTLRDPKSHRMVLDEARTAAGRPYNNNNSSSSSVNEHSGINEEALSDAIVASSLASSRASSRKRTPPPPPPQRRHGARSTLRHHTEQTRSISPLRHTLRNSPTTEEEVRHDHRHRRLLIHKHPHKHHEGDRKRWRSEITERARKRYEGVWAANKGLAVPTQEEIDKLSSIQGQPSIQYPSDASEMVINVVVRDIWSRSRLQPRILEKIWSLVDEQKIGLLTREEFVVGMWLIDQQLKGHKLPVQVPTSVWSSVNRVSGISLEGINFST
ncbi:Increased rDNA silencing protein [Aspergillus nanangensis]|uniref:Increased rDNA silencing protein n=1 Tax=Aspergillus nanangensis TaxID=2582783 RepID=A0AAD4GY71_ASPNN|nr:Increased rDNA silencing protein [Aspergillus nanangensis]